MFKARAIERFLSQVVDKDKQGGITGVMLFNKDGMMLAKTCKSFSNSNVYAAFLSNIWETFEQQGVRNELTEMLISCDAGMIAVMRISPLLLAIVSDGSVPVGQLKVKLKGLSEHLQVLAAMITHSQNNPVTQQIEYLNLCEDMRSKQYAN